MNIYFDNRLYKNDNKWICWVISAGNSEFVKIAGARELKNKYIYEMYCRQENKHIALDLETSDKNVFVDWFKSNFNSDPFDRSLIKIFPGSGEPGHRFNQVKPSYFSGPYKNLWKNTPALFIILSKIYP